MIEVIIPLSLEFLEKINKCQQGIWSIQDQIAADKWFEFQMQNHIPNSLMDRIS